MRYFEIENNVIVRDFKKPVYSEAYKGSTCFTYGLILKIKRLI